LRRIGAKLGRTVTHQDGLHDLGLPHLSSIAAVAERLAIAESAWAIRVVVRSLTGDSTLATRADGANDADLLALAEHLAAAHAEALTKGVLSRVASRVPPGCGVDATRLHPVAAAALRSSDDDKTIASSLASLVTKTPEAYVEGAARWMAAEEQRILAEVSPVPAGPVPPGLALDLENCLTALRSHIRETFFQEVDRLKWFVESSRRSRLTRIAATLGRTPGPPDELGRLQVAHLSSVAAVAERLAATLWAFREVLPRLISDAAFAAKAGASTDTELFAAVNEVIAARAEALAKAAFAEVSGRMPSGCHADVEKLQPAAAAALRTGKHEKAIVASLADLVRKTPEAYVACAGAWIEAEAARVLSTVRPSLAKWIPPGLGLDSEKCLTALRERVRETFFQEADAAEWFSAKFEASRDPFIAGIDAWYDQQAAACFKALRPVLERDLPPGCTVLERACVETIVQLLRKPTPLHDLLARFGEAWNAEPTRFIQGLRELLHVRAVEIFHQLIKPGLVAFLPDSCSLNEGACIELVERLLNDGPAEKLFERFVETIAQSLTVYVRGLPTPSRERDDAPYRSQPSGARLSSGR